MSPWSMIVSDV